MKFKELQERYKNTKQIDFLYDLKHYKGLKSSIIIPYACMIAPIVVTWILYFCHSILNIELLYVGRLNTFPIWLFIFAIILFCTVDIRQIVVNIIDNRKNIHPIIWLKTSIKQFPEVLFLAFMFIWILIATILNPATGSVLSIKYETSSYITLQEGVLFYLGYAIIFIFSFMLKDKQVYEKLLIAFLISSIFAGISTIIDPYGNFILASHNNTGWAFSMINSNHYGYFLTLAVICSACMFLTTKSRGLKIFTGITFLLNTIILIFNDTLGCMLAVLAVLVLIPIIFSIRAKKFQWIYSLPLGIFLVLTFILTPLAEYVGSSTYKGLLRQIVGLVQDFFNVTSNPLSEEASHAGTDRWSLWLKAFEGIKEHPWIGTGDVIFKPHNEYLQHAYNFGILCLAFYLISLVIILVKVLKNLRRLSDITLILSITTLSYLISALFGNTMPHTIIYFLVILGITIRSLNIDIQNKKQKEGNTTEILTTQE